MCLDYSSASCNGESYYNSPCCPESLPFCRNFLPYGLGCYASAVFNFSKTIPPMGPLDGGRTALASSTSTEWGSLDGTSFTQASSTDYSSTLTETVSVVSLPSGQYSYAFPSVASQTAGLPISTTFVLAFPSSSLNSSTDAKPMNTTSSSRESVRHTPTTSTITSHKLSSTQMSLCFDIKIGGPGSCSSGASSTNNGGIPGASTVSSGGLRLRTTAIWIVVVLILGMITCGGM